MNQLLHKRKINLFSHLSNSYINFQWVWVLLNLSAIALSLKHWAAYFLLQGFKDGCKDLKRQGLQLFIIGAQVRLWWYNMCTGRLDEAKILNYKYHSLKMHEGEQWPTKQLYNTLESKNASLGWYRDKGKGYSVVIMSVCCYLVRK